jgi:hypothetical protein
MDFQYWMDNPNVEIKYYPDVGAKFLFYQVLRCDWAHNLNCSFGIGLGDALWKVGLVYLIIIVVFSLTFPGALSLLSIVFTVIIYVLVVAYVAWLYSPACILLFPSNQLGPAVSIPVLPIPLNILPALPMCLWDEVIEVLDSIFASCYTWIPQAILNTAQCLPCPEKLGFINCADVGMADALSVFIYWGYRFFGPVFCDIMRGISTALSWIPGFSDNVQQSCTIFRQGLTETQVICAYFSFGTLAWVALIIFAIATFIAIIISPILNVVHAIILLVPTLWIYDAMLGGTESRGSFVVDGQGTVTYEKQKQLPDKIASGIKKFFIPSYKKTQ